MHELPITQSIVRISVEEAEKHNAKSVKEIKIKVGELSGLVPECIQYYYDLLSKGTIAEGAVIKMEKVLMNIKCKDCGYTVELKKAEEHKCAACGSSNVKIEGGNEFYIESMEIENM